MKKYAPAFLILIAINSYSDTKLVSDQEMRESNETLLEINPRTSSVKDAPKIELVFPKLPGRVTSPTVIDLRFQAIAPSSIKPSSFKSLYGTLQIDITNRLLNVAKVNSDGVRVDEVSLPKGQHKILLTIEDSLGRIGSQAIEFEVN